MKSFSIPNGVENLFKKFCVDCHGVNGKGGVNLTNLKEIKLNERLDVLNKVQDQLFFKMMPPSSADHPDMDESRSIAEWVRTELRQHKASKLDDKLPYPDGGNYVDHATLFGGKIQDKAFTPARRWLVSPQIFAERVLDVFQLQGKEREQFRKSGFFGVTNPFVLPDHSGVRYYDLHTLDGGHLLVMMSNAEWISTKQLQAGRIKSGELKPNAVENPKDRWYPKTTHSTFETILSRKDAPSDAEVQAAIHHQFDCVLQRNATEIELNKYLQLTQGAIKIAGNSEGLRQMLKAVLLESEFVYRLEFGTGKPDEFGRTALSPREAAFAISYALGDRAPDTQLLKAAQEGRLSTKADYEREVRRLLNDKTWFASLTDPSLGQGPSTTTAHPRLLRFFREFFGYPSAHKIFKDIKRADGIYANADRGNAGTAGLLINEADMVLADILVADRAVIETMLTTDRFYVFHPLENAKGAALIEKWRALYDILKDSDWKKNPDAVAKEHDAAIKKYFDPKGLPGKHRVNHDNSVLRVMTYFEATFGKGLTPFTNTPWQFGNGRFWYSTIYNLQSMPGRDGKYTSNQMFSYQPVQPFEIANRKGILTHPAWLIAFSANTASDPIRRGRWIREKLLAGVVPDVPITVDAKVPDDPHMTLRERVNSVTTATSCIKCHSRMNELGYPLESYDDFGRFRTLEKLEHPNNLLKENGKYGEDTYKTKPVITTGKLDDTGDPKLDGDVNDAFDLIDRLARSERVRQSIIRHAFRYFMGRNELLSDSQTLIDADQAYVKSGGSFQAVVISLLTSDSFIYRKSGR